MTCGSGHIVCEPCYQVMERKICGKCRSFIAGRATDTEEMIRKVLDALPDELNPAPAGAMHAKQSKKSYVC